MNKTGILLVQLGTPDSPKKKDVRPYLTQFLNDWRVIDFPWLKRSLLVNGIIIPFRINSSSKIYQELWEIGKGVSPLLVYSKNLQKKLAEKLKNEADVYLAMRYKNPSIPSVLAEMKKKNYEKIIVLPLFPQYASSTNGSAIEAVMQEIKDWWVIPNIEFINQFWDNEGYLNSLAENARVMQPETYDHILFSYHGLPDSHVDKVHADGKCENHGCETELTEENKFCYKAACYATTRKLVEKLGLKEGQYTVCFQSRLNKKWLNPFADETIIALAKEGKKNILAFSPAFVADCLETLVEIGVEYQELLNENGGGKVNLVPSCNDSDTFVNGLLDLISPKITK
jgi:protoporphyrin/coproporphyrin ferrochelatase